MTIIPEKELAQYEAGSFQVTKDSIVHLQNGDTHPVEVALQQLEAKHPDKSFAALQETPESGVTFYWSPKTQE